MTYAFFRIKTRRGFAFGEEKERASRGYSEDKSITHCFVSAKVEQNYAVISALFFG